jgi:UDP-N-acetylglucosamine--N-acetylmuramyl-(pentapeptide) pyrophosphoryl-undecaprenol N-acetylglucosamine transferase
MSKRFIIAGGGTGGHIFPAIAIAQSLENMLSSCELLFVGAIGKMEMEKVPQAGYKIIGLPISGFNRSALWKNIGLPFKLLKSLLLARRIVREFKPDAVIGVGGYSTFPVLKAAQARKIPTFIHEANSFAGKSNILLGKKATKIFTGTTGMERFFPAEKIIVTGNPVRKAIHASGYSKQEAAASFGLSSERTTVLIVGGSLGARSINEAVAAGLNRLKAAELQLIWQTGKLYSRQAKQLCADYSGAWSGEFIEDMGKAYAAADIVVSRAGAMSVAELSIVAKPVIFVPYPFAAEDHQTANAMHLVSKQAAWMISDQEAGSGLIDQLIQLGGDAAQQQKLKQQIKQFAIEDADRRVAKEIIDITGA